jgi:ribulose-phosphate 3-epimerase
MKLPPAGTIEIAPSVLSSDFANLASETRVIDEAGSKIVHLDVMDGHFVPNITFGAPIIKWLRKYSELCFDAHLMISEPDKYAEDFKNAGCDHITFHVETVDDPAGLINRIHDMGMSAGVCIKPKTPVASIEKVAKMCEMILVMTVEPGFGGQSFMDDAARKCIDIRKMVGPDMRIEVDGGIDVGTACKVASYGADTLVAGSAVFNRPDRAAAMKAILDDAARGLG